MCEQIRVRNGGAGLCQVQTEIQEGNGLLYQVCWEGHHRRDSVGQKERGNLGWTGGGCILGSRSNLSRVSSWVQEAGCGHGGYGV